MAFTQDKSRHIGLKAINMPIEFSFETTPIYKYKRPPDFRSLDFHKIGLRFNGLSHKNL